MIWTASALTTLVFIAPVSRLFVWRLAPFALLLAALITVVGLLRVIARQDRDSPDARSDTWRLRASLYALPVLAIGGTPLGGQLIATGKLQPALVLFAALVIAALLRHRPGPAAPLHRSPLAAAGTVALAFAFLTQPSPDPRYSLLWQTPAQQAEQALYAWVGRATPADAQFAVPPMLEFFRLRTGRAIVVDFKALPLNRTGLVEWYRRNEAQSGLAHPASLAAIARAWEGADEARLDQLACRYGVTHAVFRQPNALQAPHWREVWHSAAFRVLHREGPATCPSAAPPA